MWLRDKSVPQSSVRVEQVRDVLEMFGGVWGFEFMVRQSGFLLCNRQPQESGWQWVSLDCCPFFPGRDHISIP